MPQTRLAKRERNQKKNLRGGSWFSTYFPRACFFYKDKKKNEIKQKLSRKTITKIAHSVRLWSKLVRFCSADVAIKLLPFFILSNYELRVNARSN